MSKKRRDTLPPKTGYGNPPLQHRWQKGQSGNPKGRPPKKRNMVFLEQLDPTAAMVLSHDSKPLVLRTVEGEEVISRGEAALEKLFKLGMEGNAKALTAYLSMAARARDARKELELDLTRAALMHVERYLPQFLRAEKAGEPVPDVLPDPRDIEFLSGGTPRFRGPVNFRDKLEMDAILAERDNVVSDLAKVLTLDRGNKDARKAVIAMFRKKFLKLNAALPPRLQLPLPVELRDDSQGE